VKASKRNLNEFISKKRKMRQKEIKVSSYFTIGRSHQASTFILVEEVTEMDEQPYPASPSSHSMGSCTDEDNLLMQDEAGETSLISPFYGREESLMSFMLYH
jgi:hypothetical protein